MTSNEITLEKDQEDNIEKSLTLIQETQDKDAHSSTSTPYRIDIYETERDPPQKVSNEQKIYVPSGLIKKSGFQSSSSGKSIYVEWSGLTYRVPEKIFKKNTKEGQSFNEKFLANKINKTRSSWWWWWNKKPSARLPMRLDEENLAGIGGKVGRYKTIIENIHGYAGPGLLAIMGPSGSGKTTLLNLLGDRFNKKSLEGSITLNGYMLSKDSKRYIAYCTQDDIFFPNLTVRQTLTYTALLRLPREMDRDEKLRQVENVIQLLNLSKCANTIIGDAGIRGISGGERKRVSIASELLTDPSVILLDEPTSGLDSLLALELVKILKEFALQYNKTIIMVIHQPSSQVFDLFDQLMVLADGRMVYFDRAVKLINYLAQEGFKCHSNFNPADYILELLHNPVSKRKLIDAYARRFSSDQTGKDATVMQNYGSPQSEGSDTTAGPIIVHRRWEATFKEQLAILTERSFKQRRKVILSKLDLIQMFVLTIAASVVWFRVPYQEVHIVDRVGSIYFMCLFWSFNSIITTVSAFPTDRNVLSKERQARSYRLSAYFLAKTFAEIPLSIVCPSIFITCLYWISNMIPSVGRFFAYLIVILLTTTTAQSVGYFFGAAFLDIQKAMTSATLFMLSSLLFSGFYVVYIPDWIKWMGYFSFTRYSFDLLMQIQFDTPLARYQCANQAGGVSNYQECFGLADGEIAYISGHSVLEVQKVNDLSWYWNLSGLAGIWILARTMAYFTLRRTGGRRMS